ncbi:MAG: TAXI family TRAP transporter solute-binding subunit [Desulfobacterales bacterium]|jgi:TRAP transporter TAXI family solute receptor|nr:TAXI family TRAP transporter solute-binding subunit [Desulfobacterales bacterium]
MKRNFFIGALIWIVMFSSSVSAKQIKIIFATGGIGGVYLYYGTQIAAIITENTPYQATAIQTAASIDNNLLLRDKTDPEKGIYFCETSLPDSAYVAYTGTHKLFKEKPAPSRILWMMYPNYLQIVTTADRGIKTVKDLAGKRVSTGAPGSGTEFTAMLVLKAAGVKPDSFKKWEKLGAKESTEALSNGTIDAYFWSGGLPTGSIVELATTLKRRNKTISFVSIPKDSDVVKYFDKNFSGLAEPGVISKGVYESKSDTPTIRFWNWVLAPKSLPDNVAYDMVKAVFTHLDQLHRAIKPASMTTAENTAKFIGKTTIPFHPGAIKYFKEIGAVK